MKIDGAIEVAGIIFPDGTKLAYNPATGRVEWDRSSAGDPAPTYTQTFSTADRTHAADGSADAAAATATSIAAAIPAAAPAGGTGAAAGAWDTAANRDSAITTINDLRTWAIEMDLDYEAIVVDVADIRAQFNLLRAAAADAKQLVNSVIDDLQALGIFL